MQFYESASKMLKWLSTFFGIENTLQFVQSNTPCTIRNYHHFIRQIIRQSRRIYWLEELCTNLQN